MINAFFKRPDSWLARRAMRCLAEPWVGWKGENSVMGCMSNVIDENDHHYSLHGGICIPGPHPSLAALASDEIGSYLC